MLFAALRMGRLGRCDYHPLTENRRKITINAIVVFRLVSESPGAR